MAYCRFACPTGALLKMMSSGGSRDRMGLRDKVALALVVTMLGFVFIERYSNLRNANAHSPTTHSRSNEVSSGNQTAHRTSFLETTWSIQLRHFPSYRPICKSWFRKNWNASNRICLTGTGIRIVANQSEPTRRQPWRYRKVSHLARTMPSIES